MPFQVIAKALRFESIALVLLALFAGSPFGDANAQEESSQCSEEIFSVSQEMYRQYGLNVSLPEAEVASDSANPFPGSHTRRFPIVTQYNSDNKYVKKATFNAENFMNSTGIQYRMAKRVMQACPSTSKVGFGFAYSGYWIHYFRMPSGQIREGIQLECGRDSGGGTLQWGYFYSC